MTHSREVLAMMDGHTTTFGRKKGCVLSRCNVFLLVVIFFLGIVATGVLVYHFAPCINDKSMNNGNNVNARSFFTTESHKKEIDVRLPRSVVPDLYEIKLMPFIWENNFTFNGEVMIYVNVTQDTNNITLHANDLKIDYDATTVKEYSPNSSNLTKSIVISEQINDTSRQFHVIRTNDIFKAGKKYIIYFKFIGYLNDNLEGFYRSSYTVENQTRWIATTQFQATDARRAFPCFDEPSFKARFQINIARPTNMTSISNMPKKGDSEPVVGMANYVWDHYETSLPMSTYLVAFIVSDFEGFTSTDRKFRVWARNEAINQSWYSLNIGPSILKYYEEYFDKKFPLPKMDMVALPDFAAGAMENWGLITFRETAMLFQEGVSTSSSQQRVATVVAHELAHQWFGNLVTPSWWSDLWLNEGFASYVEYIGVDAVEPEWKILEQFVISEIQNVFTLDALASSHPISVEVGHPDEISELFDRISYGKGASIIRMMDHFLTTQVFKKGLANYLTIKEYQNAEQNDLWDALTEQAHKDNVLPSDVTVKQIMDTWTLQTGFPIVTVTRNYKTGRVDLVQDRFMLDVGPDMNSESLWWIPITYTSKGSINFNNTKPSYWMNAKKTLTIPKLNVNPNDWIIFNVQQTGFYRVNYDTTNWNMIIKQLNSPDFSNKISTINRGQLIDDAMNLARAGKLDYSIALNVTSYLKQEFDYVPWKSAFTAMGYLDNMLNKFQGYDRFRIYILKLLDNIYNKVKFQDTPEDPQLTVYTRGDVLNWACGYGHENCVKSAVEQFQNWRNSSNPDHFNPIPPNLKNVVYCTAIRVGGQSEWDFAWERFRNTNVGTEKDLLLFALGCTREPWILSQYLTKAVTENSGIRKQDTARVFGAVSSNSVGQPLVFSFLRNNWAQLKEYSGASLMTLNSIVKASTRKINTKYELQDLIEFAQEHASELSSATRAIKQSIEQAESNIRWLNKNWKTIRDWLLENTI